MKTPQKLTYLFVVVLLMVITIELTIYLIELRPAVPQKYITVVKPKTYGRIDSLLGYGLEPGTYYITRCDTFHYIVNHNEEGRRFTAPDNLNWVKHKGNKAIILGCSFTYGESLNDSATHPYILQKLCDKHNIDIRIENWGVGGYGPAQYLLQAKEIVKDTSVKYVIINYFTQQDLRIACTRCRYTSLDMVPVVEEIGNELKLEYCSLHYQQVPIIGSMKLFQLLETYYCSWKTRNLKELSHKTIKETIDILEKKGIPTFLSGINCDSETYNTINEFKKEGHKTIYYGINVADTAYNLYPVDLHPNYLANKIFADTIFSKIFANKKLQ